MNRLHSCLIAVIALFASAGIGWAADTVVHTERFPRPEIVKEGEYDGVRMEGCDLRYRAGEPVLPFKGVALLVPRGRQVESVEYDAGEEIEIPGEFTVEPAPRPFPLSRPELRREAAPDAEIYASSSPYPEEAIAGVNPQTKKGYRLLFVNLLPVKYVPAEKKLSYYDEIAVTVNLSDAVTLERNELFRGIASDEEEISRMVVNPSAAGTYR